MPLLAVHLVHILELFFGELKRRWTVIVCLPIKSNSLCIYPGTRRSKVGNSHRVGDRSGPRRGIVSPRPDIFQSPYNSNENILLERHVRRLTAPLIMILSGLIFECINCAEE